MNSWLIKIFCVVALFITMSFESDAQYSYKKNVFFGDSIYTEGNNFTKPRPGFKKRRYGIHTFFLEGGYFWGYYEGLRYSINYDILLQSSEKSAFTMRIGYGVNNSSNDSTITKAEPFIPIGVNILVGRINQFELGAGGYFFRYRKLIPPYISFGFRHQPSKGGFMFRVAIDLHLEYVYNLKGTEISKTGVYGPLVGLGWTF